MLLANFHRKEHVRHRAVSLRQHGFLVHLEMAHFGGILAVNFKFYSMSKTVKIHQNPADTSEYDAIKRGKR